MTTYVLLHGGAAGAWIWKHTEDVLRSQGHEVHSLTFSGFGERRHLIATDSTIETHVVDVVNALEFRDISDCVLVAHSYSGTVAPGVMAQAASRIRRLIYLDALVLETGQMVAEEMGFMSREQCQGVAAGVRNGTIPIYAPVAEMQREEAKQKPFRMTAERQAWMLEHLSSMPTIANVTPVVVGAETIKSPVDYIAVSDTIMKPMHAKARKLGWTVHEVEGDHAIMVGDPETTAKLLLKLS
jgi:pimeloyl-ACP methyl ester carboxylesterase